MTAMPVSVNVGRKTIRSRQDASDRSGTEMHEVDLTLGTLEPRVTRSPIRQLDRHACRSANLTIEVMV